MFNRLSVAIVILYISIYFPLFWDTDQQKAGSCLQSSYHFTLMCSLCLSELILLFVYALHDFKVIVHPKMKFQSLSTHPHAD